MESDKVQENSLKQLKDGLPETIDLKNTENITSKMKSSEKEENIISNADEPNSSTLSWPSLWRNGPRRSAFQPYKPSREVSVPRPASTTVMTNLQRGNIQAEATPATADLSWFTLCGRGDVTAEQLDEMVAQGKDINSVDEEGLSGLMWAAYHGQVHTVEALLGAGGGATVDWAAMWGETALMLAATNGHLETVRALVAAGADVDRQDHSGETALMCAVHGDHPHTVSELLSSGADLCVRNNNNCTAYDIAVDQQSLRSKAVLEKYMLSLLTTS